MQMDNAAGRLLYWLQEVAPRYADQGESLTNAWSGILAVDPEDARGRARLFRHASLLAEQCIEVRAEAAALPDHLDPDLLVEHFDQVERAIGYFTNMDGIRLNSQLAVIEATGLHSLKLLNSALHRLRPQADVPTSTVADMVEKVDRLLENLSVVEMDDEVRDFVMVRFTEVQQALQDSGVRGAKAVEAVTDSLLGNYGRQPTLWRKTMESTLGTVVGGILLQLVMNFSGLQPSADVLPPGTPLPVIEQTVHVVVEPPFEDGGDSHPATEADVVDAEIVDEPNRPIPD